ncbi:hypothetical protein EVG20_g6183, partial [Dentipellis fragilis]
DAWFKGAVLHRDVSVNNILILETGNGDNVTRRGLLNDWDLCKYKEQMGENMGPRQPNLTGTWYYRSALSLQYPYKPYRMSDDIESFIHVYHYCVYRFYKTSATPDLATIISQLYGVSVVENRLRIGGNQKLLHMYFPRPAIKLVDGNKTLPKCLAALHDVYHPHYKAIDLDRWNKTFGHPRQAEECVLTVRWSNQQLGRKSDCRLEKGGTYEDRRSFRDSSLAERKNAQLSSSTNWNFEDIAAERPVKRIKIGDMSATLSCLTESQHEDYTTYSCDSGPSSQERDDDDDC